MLYRKSICNLNNAIQSLFTNANFKMEKGKKKKGFLGNRIQILVSWTRMLNKPGV